VYNIETFFNGVNYAHVNPKVFTFYSAIDAYATYRLYEYQLSQYDREENKRLKSVLLDIEMPVLEEVVEMETRGISLDLAFTEKLRLKYNKKLRQVNQQIQEIINGYRNEIDAYKFKNQNHKLSEPILISSPTQLATLLYDILDIPMVEGRGTGKEILKQIKHPISEAILEYRGLEKLLSTYIEKLPNNLNPKTKKIHANFNQIGTDTGRFASYEPNLQNIPSKNKEIRLMFTASIGHVLVGGDFSL